MAEREIRVHINRTEVALAVAGPLLAGAGVVLYPVLHLWSIIPTSVGLGVALSGIAVTGDRVFEEKHSILGDTSRNALLEE